MAPPVWNGGSVEQPDRHRLAGLRRAVAAALRRPHVAVHRRRSWSCVAGTFGVIIGLIAGYKGGRADRWLMGWVDVQVSFPGLLLAMLLIALVGGTRVDRQHHPRPQRLDGLRPHDPRRRALGPRATVRRGGRDGRCRAAAGGADATSCPTCSRRWPRWRCSSSPASSWPRRRCRFLGLGIQYPGVTWGLDIARAGDHELFGNQWLIIYPGLLLSLTVLAVNLLQQLAAGDARPAGAREEVRLHSRSRARAAPNCERRRELDRRTRRAGQRSPAVDTPSTPLLEVDDLRRRVLHAARRGAGGPRRVVPRRPRRDARAGRRERARARASPPRRCSA